MIYSEVLETINKMMNQKQTLVIAIDGMCGSGKTRLADLIQHTFASNVFHIDDFYLPLEQRKNGWEKEGGSNIDFARFLREVLIPAKQGEDIVYRSYSCQKMKLEEEIQMSKSNLTIVEGSYSHHPILASEYALKIFLSCTKEIQKQRLIERNSKTYPNFESRWIPMENQYFQAFHIREQSDIVIDNSLNF